MKNRRAGRWLLYALLGSVLGLAGFAATPKNSLSFNETVAEKVVQTKTSGTPGSRVAASGKIAVNLTMLLDGLDVSQLNADSELEVRIGNLLLRHRLGDDRTFVPGSRKAKFVTLGTNAAGVRTSTTTTTLKWTPTALTVAIRGKSTDATGADWNSIQVTSYAGRTTTPISDTFTGYALLGGVGMQFAVSANGNVATRKVRAKDGTEFAVTTAKLGGGGTSIGAYIPPRLVIPGDETIVTTGGLDQAGGSINVSSGALAGVTIKVPPGALTVPTIFTVAENDMEFLPISGRYSGTALSIHSSATSTYDEPLEITVPLSSDPDEVPVPFYVQPDGTLHACFVSAIDRANGTFTFETSHTSIYNWIFERNLDSPEANVAAYSTPFRPEKDGFFIDNLGTTYNPSGTCLGMVAFAQWHHKNHGSGLFNRFRESVKFADGSFWSAQRIIATRAQTAMRQQRAVMQSLSSQGDRYSDSEVFTMMAAALRETQRPILIAMGEPKFIGYESGHAVLGIGVTADKKIMVYEAGDAGVFHYLSLRNERLIYPPFKEMTVFANLGEGSYTAAGAEELGSIYSDALSGFQGTGRARVTVKSHKDHDVITDDKVLLTGEVASGELLVDHLKIVNGSKSVEVALDSSGAFSILVPLVPGDNYLTFEARSTDWRNKVIHAPTTQAYAFELFSIKMPLKIVKVSGDEQSAQPGTELAATLEIEVIDANDMLIPFARTNWSIVEGGGFLQSASAVWGTTEEVLGDDFGLALMRWKLGTVAPADQKIKVTVTGLNRRNWSEQGHWLPPTPVPISISTTGPVYFTATNGCPNEEVKYTEACYGWWTVTHLSANPQTAYQLELLQNGVGIYHVNGNKYYIEWTVDKSGCDYIFDESGFWHYAIDAVPKLPMNFPPTLFQTVPDTNGNTMLRYTKN